jgi:hypothetical protein
MKTASSPAPLKSVANGRLSHGIPPEPRIDVGWQWISPEDAAGLMARNFERNRMIRPVWVSLLSRMMAERRFYPSHQGIAFDEEDRLIDGQHRLSAIIRSGVGQWLLVATGVPRQSVFAMDLHARRNAKDQIHVISEDGFSPSYSDIAAARMMFNGAACPSGRAAQLEGQVLLDFLRRHWEAIDFSRMNERFKLSSAPIRAAIGRAYYHVDRGRLRTFKDILLGDIVTAKGDVAPALLREYLFSSRSSNRGWMFRSEIYLKTCMAIRAFAAHNPIKQIVAVKNDPYQLPEAEES